MTLRTKLLAAAFVLAMSTPASAVSLSLVGGSSIPLSDDFGPLRDATGLLSAQAPFGGDFRNDLFIGIPATPSFVTTFDSDSLGGLNPGGLVITGGDALITYTYIGTEAGNTNTAAETTFGSLFNNKTAKIGDFEDRAFIAGIFPDNLLNFSFSTNGKFTGGVAGTAVNGGMISSGLSISFGDITTTLDGVSFVYALFGDGAGDSDLDDIVIRITATDLPANFGVVPLPAALPLYGTGLAIMGFIGWRRKRRSAA